MVRSQTDPWPAYEGNNGRDAHVPKRPSLIRSGSRDSMWGPTFPELVEALSGVPIIDRSDDTEMSSRSNCTFGAKRFVTD
jgi:hypothetical protein